MHRTVRGLVFLAPESPPEGSGGFQYQKGQRSAQLQWCWVPPGALRYSSQDREPGPGSSARGATPLLARTWLETKPDSTGPARPFRGRVDCSPRAYGWE